MAYREVYRRLILNGPNSPHSVRELHQASDLHRKLAVSFKTQPAIRCYFLDRISKTDGETHDGTGSENHPHLNRA